MGKYFIKIGKISAKIHEIGNIKAIFGLGMTPIYGHKNGLIKSLNTHIRPNDMDMSNLFLRGKKGKMLNSLFKNTFESEKNISTEHLVLLFDGH